MTAYLVGGVAAYLVAVVLCTAALASDRKGHQK